MRKECVLGQLEEVLEALAEEVFPEELLIERDEDGFGLFVSGLRVHIPELGLQLREGYMGQYQEDEDWYMPDFSLTVFYRPEAAAEDYLLWERDSPWIALKNQTGKEFEELAPLRCIITIDDA